MYTSLSFSELTHCGWMICHMASYILVNIGSVNGLVTCLVPSHYLNLWWLIDNWPPPRNIIQWCLNENLHIFNWENVCMFAKLCQYYYFSLNILTHCGLMTSWRHRSGSTLAQVMACCLTAPSHYLNQCWLIISEIQLHSSDGNFTRNTSVIND